MKSATPLVLAAALAAGLLGLFAERQLQRSRTVPPVPEVQAPASIRPGDLMPVLVLSGLDGKPVQLPAGFAGRPLLINFWASWCAPCLQEMPALQRYSRAQGRDGVQVIGIALDTPQAVREFLAHTPVGYPVLLDSAGSDDASVRLGNRRGVLPYSVLLDRQGRILDTHLGGFRDHDEISAWAQR